MFSQHPAPVLRRISCFSTTAAIAWLAGCGSNSEVKKLEISPLRHAITPHSITRRSAPAFRVESPAKRGIVATTKGAPMPEMSNLAEQTASPLDSATSDTREPSLIKSDVGYPAEIPALTSLRFFAAMWVVLLHYADWLPGKAPPIISRGTLAVDFFFMLSGFILVHAHRRQIATRTLAARLFYVKRLARIYPLHFATLIFYAVMVGALALMHKALPNPARYSLVQFVLNLLLLHAVQIKDAGSWNYPSWSVGSEWIAYLAFPLFATLIFERLHKVRPAVIVVFATLIFLAVYAASPLVTGVPFLEIHSNFGYLRVLPEFLLGMALYRLFENQRAQWFSHAAAIPLLTAAILLTTYWGQSLLTIGLLAALICAAAEASRARFAPTLLSSRPLKYLGTNSYALYMVHLPVSTVLFQGAKTFGKHVSPAFVGAGIPIAIAVAALAHHWIEIPGHRLVMALLAPKRAQLRAAAAPSP
jgi:peptidoglycan/LPS O-acetylase OafA/YrhL